MTTDTHRPRKRFGQHFLRDPGMVDRILRSLSPGPADRLVEIGPGQGALTLPLLRASGSLQVIEIDRDLAAGLANLREEFPGLEVHREDALQFDFAQLAGAETLRIVGNLPYNITTPLLFHLTTFLHCIHDMHFMLQKEVVDRIAAAPGNKTYGRLSVMLQYCCEAQPLFEVPPDCFVPRPQVTSAVLRLRPRREAPARVDQRVFRQVVAACFQQRRKTLRNSLRTLLPAEAVASLDVDTKIRPENLSVDDFVDLANRVARHPIHQQ